MTHERATRLVNLEESITRIVALAERHKGIITADALVSTLKDALAGHGLAEYILVRSHPDYQPEK